MLGYERKLTYTDTVNTKTANNLLELSSEQVIRRERIRRAWNFYEGYHWEELPETDGVEMTLNYVRAFINRFVSFELGNGVRILSHEKLKGVEVDKTEHLEMSEYLRKVYENNGGGAFLLDLGQMKSVTGEAWVLVNFLGLDEIEDPYEEYETGRVQLLLQPTGCVFPVYDSHRRDSLKSVMVTYLYNKQVMNPVTGSTSTKQAVYKQIWTKTEIRVIDDGHEEVYPNLYNIIPFVCIRNVSLSASNVGQSDIEDLIPINIELNRKSSDISEIIDYHASPVTIVKGAKIGALEKGANKVWGGLPPTASVENLTMNTDLTASNTFAKELKQAMIEIGGLPESLLGGATNISNTSGVALQYANLPLVEKNKTKTPLTKKGLENLNKMIIYISIKEGLIEKPSNVTNAEFYFTSVETKDTLPKDEMSMLQQIEYKLKLGLTTRKRALEMLGEENAEKILDEVTEENKKYPDFSTAKIPDEDNVANSNGNKPLASTNSGFTNGEPDKNIPKIKDEYDLGRTKGRPLGSKN